MLKEARPMTFDNLNSTLPPVQVCREVTASNGCQITMIFPQTSPNTIRLQVAVMLLTAFIKRRSDLS